MAGTGSRPGERRGGRKKGTPNKRTLLAADRHASQIVKSANGIMPLDVMLTYMRDRYINGDMPTAHMAARDCAPYLHPRLTAADVRVQQKPADADEETSKRLAIEAFVAAFGPRSVPKKATETPTLPTPAVEAVVEPASSDDDAVVVPLPKVSGE